MLLYFPRSFCEFFQSQCRGVLRRNERRQRWYQQDCILMYLQQAYKNSGNQKKVLFLLCLELCLSETDDSPLLLYENKPWSRLPKTEMRPVNVNIAKEIVRRARLLRIHPTPQPLNWPKAQKIEWLETNPVQGSIDILFLRGNYQGNS